MFKFQITFKGERYQGNSVDDIANYIAKDHGISFVTAVGIVNKSIIPVHVSQLKEFQPHLKPKKKVGLKEIKDGAVSAMRQISGDTVSQVEINRRSQICVGCPRLQDTGLCIPCGQGAALMKFVNGVKKLWGGGFDLSKDVKNSFCDVCDCSLAMMLPAPLDHFKEATKTDPTRPKNCWIKG